jgi:hypothetical protein
LGIITVSSTLRPIGSPETLGYPEKTLTWATANIAVVRPASGVLIDFVKILQPPSTPAPDFFGYSGDPLLIDRNRRTIPTDLINNRTFLEPPVTIPEFFGLAENTKYYWQRPRNPIPDLVVNRTFFVPPPVIPAPDFFSWASDINWEVVTRQAKAYQVKPNVWITLYPLIIPSLPERGFVTLSDNANLAILDTNNDNRAFLPAQNQFTIEFDEAFIISKLYNQDNKNTVELD